ncbi:MAG: Rieske (2Fe-2S) protein [Pseudomonadota bacterium]
MSVRYEPVQWGLNKYLYDAVLLLAVVGYIYIFVRVGTPAADLGRPIDGAVVRMRAFGSCAFLMMTFILCIGPLARLDRRFLPLLYNRRHFGVLTALVAFTHTTYVLDWYYAFSATPPLEGLLIANAAMPDVRAVSFEYLGLFALLALGILAATSHDFWLHFLTPAVWKTLHLLIYPAYLAVVAHVAFGYLQSARDPTFALVVGAGALSVALLHLMAWRRPRPQDRARWLAVAPVERFEDGRAIVVGLAGDERAAVFRRGDSLSAISNACAHQNGPLGEGRIIDGCVTCPWHGFQYRLEDGCAPAPYTERLPTYNLRLAEGQVWIDRRANPPGTPVPPLSLEGGT